MPTFMNSKHGYGSHEGNGHVRIKRVGTQTKRERKYKDLNKLYR